MLHKAMDLYGFFERPRKWRRDIRIGTRNIRILNRTGSLQTVSSKLAKYNLDIMAVQ
jgi:hypothetical protein